MKKYWKGLDGSLKQGMFGAMESTGHVPDSEESRLEGYQAYVDSLPAPQIVNHKVEFGKAATPEAKIQCIAEYLKLA